MADRVGRELELLFQGSAYQAEDDLVFGHPHTGHPLERGQVSKRFKRTLKRAGVREVRFHEYADTFGTRCAAAGVPLRTLQAWMGHADIKTTMVYMHYAPGANAADLVNGVFQPGGMRLTAAPTSSDLRTAASSAWLRSSGVACEPRLCCGAGPPGRRGDPR